MAFRIIFSSILLYFITHQITKNYKLLHADQNSKEILLTVGLNLLAEYSDIHNQILENVDI